MFSHGSYCKIPVNNVEGSYIPFSKILGVQVDIQMDPQIKPVFQPLRRVPIPLEAAVDKKIEELLARDIIETKSGPTTWVSPLVIVGKSNGDVRLCLDLRRVNEAVLREQHPMACVDEYLARLGRNAFRSKMDINLYVTDLLKKYSNYSHFVISWPIFVYRYSLDSEIS